MKLWTIFFCVYVAVCVITSDNVFMCAHAWVLVCAFVRPGIARASMAASSLTTAARGGQTACSDDRERAGHGLRRSGGRAITDIVITDSSRTYASLRESDKSAVLQWEDFRHCTNKA